MIDIRKPNLVFGIRQTSCTLTRSGCAGCDASHLSALQQSPMELKEPIEFCLLVQKRPLREISIPAPY